MMDIDPVNAIDRLVLELARLPGVGPRSAERLAHYIIRQSADTGRASLARDLSAALRAVADEVTLCQQCRSLTVTPVCSLCSDERRNQAILCVVESVSDLQAIERTGAHRGRYFVLHGTLSPLDGIGPERLGVDHLVALIAQHEVGEVILACNATLEGDTTALYLGRLLGQRHIAVTRLASGVPQGGELTYLDGATLGRALRERRSFVATS